MQCQECDADISKPAVTLHRGTADDLKFCTTFCYTDWSFERSIEHLKRAGVMSE